MGSTPSAAFGFGTFANPLEPCLLTCKINIRLHNSWVVLRIILSASLCHNSEQQCVKSSKPYILYTAELISFLQQPVEKGTTIIPTLQKG